MTTAYIGVGSNIDPEANILRALRLLRRRVRIRGVSTFYLTEALGRPDQPAFINGILKVETDIPPAELKRSVLRNVEQELGRVRTGDKYAPRTIDLDILLYGDSVISAHGMHIPDSDIQARPFIAVPLCELSPELVMPGTGKSIRQVVEDLPARDMTPLVEYTSKLGKELEMNLERVEQLVKELLIEIGEDPTREGLIDTPRRVAQSWKFITSGYNVDSEKVINGAIFTQEINNMVIIRDVELYSMCEHHMLPFFGRCHIGYIPREGKVLGISKLARLVDAYSRRLQLQERLTEQIAQSITDAVHPEGVGVIIEAHHLCMMMRGCEKQNSMMTTSAVRGSFHDVLATRNEFLTLINRPHFR